MLREKACFCSIRIRCRQSPVDPADDYFVALALAVGADAIVSGDKDLTELADPPVTVLTPREFLGRLERG